MKTLLPMMISYVSKKVDTSDATVDTARKNMKKHFDEVFLISNLNVLI